MSIEEETLEIARPLSEAWMMRSDDISEAGKKLTLAGVPDEVVQNAMDGLAALAVLCHLLSVKAGWWNNKDGTRIDPRDPLIFATKTALIHSEVSEFLEGGRKGLADAHIEGRSAEEVELADALIRIGDLAGARKLEIAGAVIEKLAYNMERADHKPENRNAEGGKAF